MARTETAQVLPTEVPAVYITFRREETPRLVAFLLKLGHASGVAEDAAEEAMTRAGEHWETIRSPRAWVRKVAARRAAAIAKRDNEREVRQVRSWQERDAFAPDPYDRLEARMELDWLLGLLTPRQRKVMVWKLDGFSTAEIARELELEPETVRSHLRHAKERIVQLYDWRTGELR